MTFNRTRKTFLLVSLLFLAGISAHAAQVVTNISSSQTTGPCAGTSTLFTAADCLVEGSSSSLLPTGRLTFLAEGRFGNNAGNGTYELSMRDGSQATAYDQTQFTWTNGAGVPPGAALFFTLDYDYVGQVVRFRVGSSPTLDSTGDFIPILFGQNGRVSDIFIRTRTGPVGSSALITSLRFSDTPGTPGVASGSATPLAGSSNATNPTGNPESREIDYLWITGVNNSFRLEGTILFSWSTGAVPSNSNVAFQIKAGEAVVPEPATLGLAGLALTVLGLIHRHRRRA